VFGVRPRKDRLNAVEQLLADQRLEIAVPGADTPLTCDRVLRSTRTKGSMPTFPEWWNWDLSFTGHAELRMEQRGVTEVEVRAMLERATGSRLASWRVDS
jgi:hypothetical protein